jgi:hypothetical protein
MDDLNVARQAAFERLADLTGALVAGGRSTRSAGVKPALQGLVDVSASVAVFRRKCELRLAVGDLVQNALQILAGERPFERAGDVAVVLSEVHQAPRELLK